MPGYTGGYRVRRCCDLPTCAGHYWIEAGHYFVETYEDATEAQARADDLTKSGLYPSQV